MKKLIMFLAAVFAISATSFAQVEAPAKPTAPSVEMKQKKMRTAKNTKEIPRNMRTASTPEQRTAKIVDRINQRLTAKDPKLALTDEQRTQLIAIHMERQEVQQSRPRLETQEDKEAYMASRKAASKLFKKKLANILTPEQNAAYMEVKRDKKAKRAVKATKKSEKPMKQPKNIEKKF